MASRPSRSGQRPGGLLAILIIAGLVGLGGACMGGFGVLGGIFQLVFPDAQRNTLGAFGPVDPRIVDSQVGFLDAMQRVIPYQIADQSMSVLLSVALLIGVALAYSWKESGRRLLVISFAVAIAVGFLSAGLNWHVQNESMAAMGTMMEGMMEAGPAPSGAGAPPPFDASRFSEGLTSVMSTFTLVSIVIWLVVKTVFYALSIRYLRSPEIRARFGAT